MATQCFLGCSGFYYVHWRGLFYPESLPKWEWLQYYAKHFNTVEVNSSFYRFPKESMVKGWRDRTPENFTFTLKANRAITHIAKFKETEQLIDNFYAVACILKDKLLAVLFQLPPSIQKNMELLERIASQINPEITNILEFRHESWWDSEVYNFMVKKRLVFCSVSASGLPDQIVKTSSTIYVRFHGKNGWYQQNYPDDQLKTWAENIKTQNLSRILCYFNNDYRANAVRNCMTLRKFLGAES